MNQPEQPEQPSKRQLKKQAKKAHQKEQYKQQKLLRKQIKKANPPAPKSGEKKPPKKNREIYKQLMQNGTKVVIDLQFLDQMTESEKTSLYKQIELCHSTNFKSDNPINLIVTSITDEFLELISKSNGQNWGIALEKQHYTELFSKDQLVYLTGDTDEEIQTLGNDVYIIGGLVDHNRLKKITYNQAKSEGIRTLRLPIRLDLKSSSILTVNQVFEILFKVQNGDEWDTAIESSVPKRKLNA